MRRHPIASARGLVEPPARHWLTGRGRPSQQKPGRGVCSANLSRPSNSYGRGSPRHRRSWAAPPPPLSSPPYLPCSLLRLTVRPGRTTPSQECHSYRRSAPPPPLCRQAAAPRAHARRRVGSMRPVACFRAQTQAGFKRHHSRPIHNPPPSLSFSFPCSTSTLLASCT
eukprot:scaffold5800_cov98-Isochrysis_galbana.AAC.4